VKKAILRILHVVSFPAHFVARALHDACPQKQRKAQVVIGLLLLLAGMLTGEVFHAIWVQIATETVKAVGVAPICKVIVELIEWDA